MVKTDVAPLESLKHVKRTKIIATIGPSTDSYEAIYDMLTKGVNGFRLNFSHGDHEERAQQIRWIRKASREYGKPIAIIQDLQGPKMRCGEIEGMIHIEKGQEYCLEHNGDFTKTGNIPTQIDLSNKVKRGDTVKFFDGKIETTVTSVRGGKVYVKANNKGILTSKKGINVPDVDFKGDIFTKKDKADVIFGVHHDIDYVALSFVQTEEDVKNLKRFLKGHGSEAKIISKIETKSAIEHLDGIIKASDAVMVARGDLAIETTVESVPVLTRSIIGKCIENGRVSIIATQMLASMTETPEPTRAEVSDVATAVIVGADCVMLSDETASGKYPIESVKIMREIIVYTQENSPLKPVFYKEKDSSIQSSISSAALTLAHQVEARAIVAETRSGKTAISISAHRPNMPIIMVTSEKRVAQQLAIVYGGRTYVRPMSETAARRLTDWLRSKKVFKKGDIIVSASGQHPGQVGATDTIKVRKLE